MESLLICSSWHWTRCLHIAEISLTSLLFFDVLVSIKTPLYRKPSNRLTYLSHSTCNYPRIKFSTFYLLLRLKRIHRETSYHKYEDKIHTQNVLSNGYLYKLISEQINRAF